jgi:hypothetical protein
MMLITNESVLEELQRAVPSFRIDPEWLADKLTFPAFNDFARFICTTEEALHLVSERKTALSQMEASMAFLERALHDGDDNVRNLVLECIETLASCERIDRIRKYFRPEVDSLWERFSSGFR